MASSLRLVALLWVFAAVTVFAQDLKPDFLDEVLALSHNVQKRATNKDQSVIYGAQGSNDSALFHEFIDVPKGFLQVKKRDIVYPPTAKPNNSTITCIKITDFLKTGKNANFKVSCGGLGQKFAIINMKSQRGGPIKYDVLIYGR